MTCLLLASYTSGNHAGFTWLELSPLTGRKHQVRAAKCYLVMCEMCLFFCWSLTHYLLYENPFSPMWETQLRVHCAEVLGTPIVGDLKYGWQAHRKWKHLPCPNLEKKSNENVSKGKTIPFGLDLESGSISEKHPRLHLHCKHMVLPDVSLALRNVQCSSDYDLSEVENLELVAPLPSYMQRSWAILNS
jgi:23S rRNA-/tRNA-specific pseudouridylate synthase